MANEKAQKIVRDAMENPEIYAGMAKRESEVWSEFFSDPLKEEIRKKEMSAGTELKPGRKHLRLPQVLAKHRLTPRAGLSLGCGSGRAERQFLKRGICQSFHGIDIAPEAIDEAARLASDEGLQCTYETHDLNFLKLSGRQFDLVVAQTSLHHVLHLEHLMDEVSKCLSADGVFWVHDYIGESQFQFSDDRLRIMNEILALLPKKLTFNHFANRNVDKVMRREPGTLVSPFESIRSGEIKELLLQRFDVIEKHEETAFLHRVAGMGMKQNFIGSEETRSIFELLYYFDSLLVERGIVPPVLGQYLLRPKQ